MCKAIQGRLNCKHTICSDNKSVTKAVKFVPHKVWVGRVGLYSLLLSEKQDLQCTNHSSESFFIQLADQSPCIGFADDSQLVLDWIIDSHIVQTQGLGYDKKCSLSLRLANVHVELIKMRHHMI